MAHKAITEGDRVVFSPSTGLGKIRRGTVQEVVSRGAKPDRKRFPVLIVGDHDSPGTRGGYVVSCEETETFHWVCEDAVGWEPNLTKRHIDLLWQIREETVKRFTRWNKTLEELLTRGYVTVTKDTTDDEWPEARYKEVMVTLLGEDYLDGLESDEI